MNYQYLSRLDKEIPYLKNKYNKILYLYEYKKGDTLKYYSEVNKLPYINVNLYLSEKLMDVKPNRRPYKVVDLMNSLGDNDDDIICIDYFEILFEPSLKLQPFDILKNLSRRKTVLVAWRYELKDGYLVYAQPGHPEYKKGTPRNNADNQLQLRTPFIVSTRETQK